MRGEPPGCKMREQDAARPEVPSLPRGNVPAPNEQPGDARMRGAGCGGRCRVVVWAGKEVCRAKAARQGTEGSDYAPARRDATRGSHGSGGGVVL